MNLVRYYCTPPHMNLYVSGIHCAPIIPSLQHTRHYLAISLTSLLEALQLAPHLTCLNREGEWSERGVVREGVVREGSG